MHTLEGNIEYCTECGNELGIIEHKWCADCVKRILHSEYCKKLNKLQYKLESTSKWRKRRIAKLEHEVYLIDQLIRILNNYER